MSAGVSTGICLSDYSCLCFGLDLSDFPVRATVGVWQLEAAVREFLLSDSWLWPAVPFSSCCLSVSIDCVLIVFHPQLLTLHFIQFWIYLSCSVFFHFFKCAIFSCAVSALVALTSLCVTVSRRRPLVDAFPLSLSLLHSTHSPFSRLFNLRLILSLSEFLLFLIE